jgi:hypothetical protein
MEVELNMPRLLAMGLVKSIEDKVKDEIFAFYFGR